MPEFDVTLPTQDRETAAARPVSVHSRSSQHLYKWASHNHLQEILLGDIGGSFGTDQSSEYERQRVSQQLVCLINIPSRRILAAIDQFGRHASSVSDKFSPGETEERIRRFQEKLLLAAALKNKQQSASTSVTKAPDVVVARREINCPRQVALKDTDTTHTVGKEARNARQEHFVGGAEIGLERVRMRLLDLTNRNKLLSFRHTPASSIRFVDVRVDSIFIRLKNRQKMTVLSVPESDEALPPKERAAQLRWNTSFDLENTSDSVRLCLPVLHYQEELDSLSRKIASAARSAIEESGTNMLYLVFGFLEWYESESSRQPRLAPLVAMPVTVERAAGKGGSVEMILEYSGEDIETNLSLVEKMRYDFGIDIPLLEDAETPEAYFSRFADVLKLNTLVQNSSA